MHQQIIQVKMMGVSMRQRTGDSELNSGEDEGAVVGRAARQG
jgi:hypothetical protein